MRELTIHGEEPLLLYEISVSRVAVVLIHSAVRSLQVPKITLRWVEAQMQALRRAWRRVHLSGAWHQA